MRVWKFGMDERLEGRDGYVDRRIDGGMEGWIDGWISAHCLF